MITGIFMMDADVVFGQVCSDCGLTATAGCATISATDSCQFAASGGETSAHYATAFSNGRATGDSSFAAGGGYATGIVSVALAEGSATGYGAFAASQGGAEGDYSSGLSNGNGLAEYAVGIGNRCIADAAKAVAIGNGSWVSGASAISLGSANYVEGENSIAIGAYVKTNSAKTFNYVFGKGITFVNSLDNDISNSIMFGMNSNVPTVFIGNSGGTTDSYGNVGIGNITDDAASLLHVRDQVRVGYASSDNGSIIFNNSTNANTVTFKSGETTTTHEYTLPLLQGRSSAYQQW
jgi:hypothetical protein